MPASYRVRLDYEQARELFRRSNEARALAVILVAQAKDTVERSKALRIKLRIFGP